MKRYHKETPSRRAPADEIELSHAEAKKLPPDMLAARRQRRVGYRAANGGLQRTKDMIGYAYIIWCHKQGITPERFNGSLIWGKGRRVAAAK